MVVGEAAAGAAERSWKKTDGSPAVADDSGIDRAGGAGGVEVESRTFGASKRLSRGAEDGVGGVAVTAEGAAAGGA